MKRVEGESAAPPKPRKQEHTSGPWWIGDHSENPLMDAWVYSDSAKHCIAVVSNAIGMSYEQFDANCRLIAAAPELLAELEHAHDMIKHYLKAGYLPHMSAEEAEQLVRNPDSAILRAREGR